MLDNFTINKKYVIGLIIILLVIFFLYTYLFKKPRNNRNWEVGFEKLPHIEIQDTQLKINDLRNYKYAPNKFVAAQYINRHVDVNKLQRVWFLVEPFEGIPVVKFDGIAHTYFVFDFEDSEPIVISVEARREKGENFGLLSGMMNKFELMYVWGTEQDLTYRRVLVENNSLYMYPLTISKDQGQRLFMQLAKTTQQLETQPRFYNSLTSNCTNELAKNANALKPGTIPHNLVWILPGYAPKELYDLNFIPNDKSFEEIKEKYYISDLVRKYYKDKNFSEKLRQALLIN
jgi:hypothetical protein